MSSQRFEPLRSTQVRALVYVTTLGNGIMESMAHLEKVVVAALGPRQHKRHTASGEGARKDCRTSEDARVCACSFSPDKTAVLSAG